MYDNLGKIELYVLALHTLFNTGESNNSRMKKAIEKLEGKTFSDMKQTHTALRNMGLLTTTSYNWRTDSYDYSVPDEKLIETMIYFYEKQPELTVDVLKAARELQPSPFQKTLWDFISSGFSSVDIEAIDDINIYSNVKVFVPYVTDQRFLPLLSVFDSHTLFDMLNAALSRAFKNQSIIDADYVRSLLKIKGLRDYDNMRERIACLSDLYDYLANGKMPKHLLVSNKDHQTIAAIHEAYRGRYDTALNHFKKAVSLNNKSGGRYIPSSKCNMPLGMVNYFYVLIALLAGTEEGKKKVSSVCRYNEDNTAAAKVLYDILSGNVQDRKIADTLSGLLGGSQEDSRILAYNMARYIGKEPNVIQPRWLIMKHELRKYLPMSDADALLASKAYGENAMLTSIYHKQEWEKVLDELMGQGSTSGVTGVSLSKTSRMGYFIRSTKDTSAEVRQQTILKSGAWSAGKQVSLQRFFDEDMDGMTDSDLRIAKAARASSYYGNSIPLGCILPEMTEESRLYVGRYAPYSIVDVTEDMPYITLQRSHMGFYISSNVPVEQLDDRMIITHRSAASINFIHLSEEQQMYYRKLLTLGHFPLEAEEQLRRFLAGIGGKIEVNSDLIEGGSTLPTIDGRSVITMQLRPQDKETYVVSIFCRPKEGGRIRCKPGMGDKVIVDGVAAERCRVRRDRKAEVENLNALIDNVKDEVEDVAQLTESGTVVSAYDILPILEYAQQHPDSVECEWPEGAKLKLKYRQTSSAWTGAIKRTENGWFEIEGSVELDQGRVVSMAELFDLANQSQGRYIKLGDGEFLALSEKLRRQLSQLGSLASRSKGKLQMSPFSAALIGADILEGELMLTEDDELKKIRQRIKDASDYSPRVPKALHATLREYQKEGYQWMSRLNKWGAGALLADDMGLGKTVQTIAFLLSKAKEGPALVIAPASVAPNWNTEFEKFAPSLNITMLNFSPNRSVAIAEAKAGDVIVTTYGLLLSVKDEVTQKHWATICLDEAHIIKNRGAKTSAVAMKLRSDNRVMLTGTPVQNHLGELWNLFQFVNPGLLGSFEDFNRRFIVPIEQNGDKERQHDLDRLVKPFMLRRTKDKVAKELPEKEEIYQHVDLTEEEQLTYEVLRQKAEALLLAEGSGTVSMNTLAEITRLRQCACDIRLKGTDTTDADKPGSKIVALVELLQTIIDGFDDKEQTKHKADSGNGGAVLVFSQFTSYLALIRKALEDAGIHYLYIDGSVDIKTRTRLVEDFQNGAAPVFLISLKAGGLGLNLTRANYVVHMDPWWNPAIEAQATDRAHRIGQQQHVTVYHLIATGTIEEKIQRLHQRKQALVENVLAATDTSHKLTGEDLLEMVRG